MQMLEKGMIGQLHLEEMPRKIIQSNLGKDDDVQDPDSNGEVSPEKNKSSHKKKTAKETFKLNRHTSDGANMGSENDSGGALCREEGIESMKLIPSVKIDYHYE